MNPDEATARLRSFLSAETARARRHLQKAGFRNAPVPVHDTRKSIKKLRAALRLMDDMAEPEALASVAGPMREAAHRLGPLRDALVLQHTAKKLLKRGESPLPEPPPLQAAPLLQKARVQMRSAQIALRRLLRLELDPRGLPKGFHQLYRRARREMRRAGKDPTDDNLHAWRRRAKDLFYNLELVKSPRALVKKLKKLTEHLGDDHDLAFFAQHDASPEELGVHSDIFRRAAQKRARLQEKAFRMGARFFEEKPNKFARRFLK